MAISPFMAAINQIADEKGLPRETVIEAVEAAIAAAYRKDYADPENVIRAHFNEETEQWDIEQVHTIVADEEFENDKYQIALSEAQKENKDAQIGDEIIVALEPHQDFGRIAAQTAKQVIIQRIREAEREILFNEFKDKEHQVVTGSVQQIEGESVFVNLGKITALMLPSDQIQHENYYVGQRLKVYVTGVEETPRGPRVLVSRTHPELIVALFEQEVPEIQAGAVEIRAIAREAGSRTKIAVAATQPGIDPVGSCVGGRGARVQAVLAELTNEKIDIALYDEDPVAFITNALTPAQAEQVQLFADMRKALVSVPEDQLSLAIGRAGQNVRLASRLTGWSIDIAQTGMEEEKLKDLLAAQAEFEKAQKEAPVAHEAPEAEAESAEEIAEEPAVKEAESEAAENEEKPAKKTRKKKSEEAEA